MLLLQIVTQLGIAILTLITHPSTYGNPYIPLTIGAFIEAAVPHIIFIADNAAHSFIMSVPSLPAPPTRHAISGPPAIIPSKDLILWTPIGLPVSAGLHMPALTIPPIPSPSSITEERTHRPTPQLEYPTKDLIVWERYTAELVNAIEPVPLVACGIIIVCCACVMAMVFHSRYSDKVKARVSDVLPTVALDTDAGAASPFNDELALNGEDASADLFDQVFINNIISGPEQFVHPNDTLRVAGETLLEVSNDNVDNGTTLSPAQITDLSNGRMALYPHTTAANPNGDDAEYTQDIRGEHAQVNTDVALIESSALVSGQTTVLHPASADTMAGGSPLTVTNPLSTLLISSTREACEEYARRCKAISASTGKWKTKDLTLTLPQPASAQVVQHMAEHANIISVGRQQAAELRQRCEEQFAELKKQCAEADSCIAELDREDAELEQDVKLLEQEDARAEEERKRLAEDTVMLQRARAQLAAESVKDENVEQSGAEVCEALPRVDEQGSEDLRQTQLSGSGTTPSDEHNPVNEPLQDDLEESEEEFHRLLRESESQAGQERCEESTIGESTEPCEEVDAIKTEHDRSIEHDGDEAEIRSEGASLEYAQHLVDDLDADEQGDVANDQTHQTEEQEDDWRRAFEERYGPLDDPSSTASVTTSSPQTSSSECHPPICEQDAHGRHETVEGQTRQPRDESYIIYETSPPNPTPNASSSHAPMPLVFKDCDAMPPIAPSRPWPLPTPALPHIRPDIWSSREQIDVVPPPTSLMSLHESPGDKSEQTVRSANVQSGSPISPQVASAPRRTRRLLGTMPRAFALAMDQGKSRRR
ncbi:hypothetical protein POSPLADRAFT_1144245 [Postia placenta MAD-698-R-SB12]|uniref:Uncharacterized protein n=1 Tax=Postia placenta MAD-698-R-SB12 TaxID=670580 RepID=A0A1X6MZV6_9APHY|nr:hypothetical protein POSPLADRAFT_1144245 [Postia placenta MAD-698-R-SB12]OSX61894.1 hypothetical protein POSPLADRAFT_1144245 [Postia placenta MAD-698-R-SB12]